MCKYYIVDMSSMSSVIGFDEVKTELENGLKLLQIVDSSTKSEDEQ